MRKTECLLDALFLLIYQLLSCIVVYFATWMIVKIVDKFVYLGYFWSSVWYAVLISVGVGVLLWIYAYKTSYRAAELRHAEVLLASALAIFFHLLIAAVFNYLPLLSGSTRFLSGLLSLGRSFDSVEAMAQIPPFMPMALFLITMLFYHAVMLVLRRVAVNRRLMDRYEMTGSVDPVSK